MLTPVARFAGETAVTVGAATSAVVNVQTLFAGMELADTSRTPVVIVAVYDVVLESAADGVNVAVELGLSNVTVPATGVEPAVVDPQLVEHPQGRAGEVAQFRVMAFGFQLRDDDEWQDHLVFREPSHRRRIGQQDTGVQDVRARPWAWRRAFRGCDH